MTETETVEPTAAAAEDVTPLALRTWGLSGQPVRWAPTNWQYSVETIRRANTGSKDLAAVQAALDADFPGMGYQAADVALAHPPTGRFTATLTGNSVRVDLDGDQDLDLPDENVVWDFGDGTTVRDAGGYDHEYTGPGDYTVRLEVLVAGTSYNEAEVVSVGAPVPVVHALDPDLIAAGAEPIQMRVLGANFTPDCVIVFNGGDEPTTFVSASEVTTGVEASTASGTVSVPVAVRSGDGTLSNSMGFSFVGGDVEAFQSSPPTVSEQEGATALTGDEDSNEDIEDDRYDPSQYTVDEVMSYAEGHPDQVDAIYAAEESGKSRVTLLDKLAAL